MARSRSSFELDQAVATATALAPGPASKRQPPRFDDARLVSFALDEPSPRPASAPPSSLGADRIGTPSDLPPSSTTDTGSGPGLRSALPPSVREDDAELPSVRAATQRPALPPRSAVDAPVPSVGLAPIAPPVPLPDLSDVDSPLTRCEIVVDWIARVAQARDVFLADGAGLPVAGAGHDETRLAASGWIATAASALAKSLPGAPSGALELHLGDGPFFQLIGFQVRGNAYVVGMVCPTPLTPRQAGAIRIACLQALSDTLGGAS